MIKEKIILPGSTIGIVGGGQLGKMMAQSAKKMGFQVGVLEPTQPCPAGEVADFQIVASYEDEKALMDLAEKSDVLTFEFENVSVATLKKVAEKTYFPQKTQLLEISQDRLKEKNYLKKLGIPLPDFYPVVDEESFLKGIEKIGYPSVLKTTQGGYDGKGQVVLKSKQNLCEALPLVKKSSCVLEAFIPFEKEISVLVAGNERGELVLFPIGENIHRHNILHETIVPARISEELKKKASEIALKIARDVQLVGILAVELFVGQNEEIYANELAPRPHNSGHYSIELCSDSQFDAQMKGVCNWPLAPIDLLSSGIMVNILGENLEQTYDLIGKEPNYHFHYYGKKEARKGRKMGHFTLLTKDIQEELEKINQLGIWEKEDV